MGGIVCISAFDPPPHFHTSPSHRPTSVMANVATMGPPPSPKEPRRSGRRPAPSSSKSPAGSPPSEANPAASKPKDASGRPSLNSSHNNGSGRNKRAKNEELDEPLEELHKNGVNANGGPPRSKRKGKDKDKIALVVEIPNDDVDGGLEAVADDGVEENGEDEEGGVTRCICQKYGASRRVDRRKRIANSLSQAKKTTNRANSWSNARYARRGSTDNVCTTQLLTSCPITTSARTADQTCGAKS